MQSGVAAAAAVAACFSTVPDDGSWGWSVLGRVLSIEERAGPFQHSRNPMDPRLYLIAAIVYTLRKREVRPEFGKQLLTLAADANPHIAQTAMTALLRLKDAPNLAWVTAAMATELFSMHFPDINEEGERDRSLQEAHRLEARQRALARLNHEAVVSLAPPPTAWILAPRRRRSWDHSPPIVKWREPDFDFYPGSAASITAEFPVETWLSSQDRREAFLIYLQQLVRWTSDRLFPEWADADERRRRSTDMFEWLNALADLVARDGYVIPSIEAQKDNPHMWSDSTIPARIAGVVQRLAETNYPPSPSQARDLLEILDLLVDMGDRRSAALQQSEYFRGVQLRS